MTLAGKDDKLAEAKRKVLAQSYAERALPLLRQTVERGYKNATQLNSDSNLQPLLGRDEFRKLLADLERKEKK